LSKKLTVRVGLLRRLAGSKWGFDTKTLRTDTLALIQSVAEYCVPVWCRSKHTHLVDKHIHDALRLVTGCLRPEALLTGGQGGANAPLEAQVWAPI